MTFTIDNELTIKGTRGETGTIHITFDRDMTGTKGLFIVKRNADTPDNEAFLVKRFVFGSNPAITGSEVILSFTSGDTENIPILLPDSPYVFESDYKNIECSDYVWYIRLASDCYTQTVVPRPGCKPPMFRLYNDAFLDRGGCPVVPHPPFPSPDIYATKRDLIHYAASQKNVTDSLSWRIDVNARRIDEISGSISGYGSVISGVDRKIDSVVSIATEALGVATEAKELAVLVDAKVDSFTDLFTSSTSSASSVDYGVAATKVFVKDLWKDATDPYNPFPVLGASPEANRTVSDDVTNLEVAIQKLYDYGHELSGNAKATDERLVSAIQTVISGVGPGIAVLSGNVVKEFGIVRGELSSLCGAAIAHADAEVSRLEGCISSLSSNAASRDADIETTLGAQITALSSNAASRDTDIETTLGDRITVLSSNANSAISSISSYVNSKSSELAETIASLSSNAATKDASIESLVSSLSGAADGKFTAVGESIASLSSNASSKDEALAGSITSLSSNASTSDNAIRTALSALSSHVENALSSISSTGAGAVSALSGYAAAKDTELGNSIAALSANASASDGSLHSEIVALSGNAKNYVDSTASTIREEIQVISGQTYEKSVTDSLASINWFLEHTYTPWIQTSERQILKYALDAAASGDATIRGALCAEITRATGVENEKIGKDSIIQAFGPTLTNDQVPGALATYNFVNSSINGIAAYYITNSSGNAFPTKAALDAAVASGELYNGGKKRTPTMNDYCVVLADETHVDKGLTPTTRYIYDGTRFAFQYVINSTTFTQANIDALNSGITSAIISTLTSNDYAISGNLSSLSSDYSQNKESLWTTVGTHGTDIATVSGSISVLSEDIGDLRDTVSGNYASLNSSILSLSGSLSATNGSIETLRSDVASADADIRSSVSGLSAAVVSSVSQITGDVSELSSNAASADSSLRTSISSLSSNASASDEGIRSSISALSGAVSENIGAVNTSISSLSSNAASSDSSLASAISSLSSNASSAIGSLSSNAFGAISSLSANASSRDSVLASNISTLSGYSADYESRIKSFEESRYFDSVAESRIWCKGYISGLVFKADGTMDPSSKYDDQQVLTLVLGIVSKLASNGRYFESRSQANAWIASYIPGIKLNPDGTLIEEESEYTDEEVLKLVLAIVGKMATLH